jgi:hypothetical protein
VRNLYVAELFGASDLLAFMNDNHRYRFSTGPFVPPRPNEWIGFSREGVGDCQREQHREEGESWSYT